jgi:hypothetical protein
MRDMLLRIKALLLGVETAQCPICEGLFIPTPWSIWDWMADAPVCFKCESEAIRRNNFLFPTPRREK